jgi:hypothetical protein
LKLQDTPNFLAESIALGLRTFIDATQRASVMIREQKLFHHEGVPAISSLLPFDPYRSGVEPLDLCAILVQHCAGHGTTIGDGI